MAQTKHLPATSMIDTQPRGKYFDVAEQSSPKMPRFPFPDTVFDGKKIRLNYKEAISGDRIYREYELIKED